MTCRGRLNLQSSGLDCEDGPGFYGGVYESLVRILCGFQKQFYTGLAGLGL